MVSDVHKHTNNTHHFLESTLCLLSCDAMHTICVCSYVRACARVSGIAHRRPAPLKMSAAAHPKISNSVASTRASAKQNMGTGKNPNSRTHFL
jgi:hypothetical protein